MYDELIKGLRMCEDGGKCDLCPKWLDKQNGGLNACTSALSKDAADAIEELQLYMDLYKDLTEKGEKIAREVIDKYPKWIPVTERLPEKYDRVLVYSKATRMGRGIDFINADGNWYTTPKVTHWMPIPELPKEET